MEIHEFQEWREQKFSANPTVEKPDFMTVVPYEIRQKFGENNLMNLFDDIVKQLHELQLAGALANSEQKFLLGAIMGIQAVVDHNSSFNRNYNPLFN